MTDQEEYLSVFISYSRQDMEFVDSLVDGLVSKGMRPDDIWIDRQDIAFSTKWWDEIVKGIQTSNVFIFVISPHSVTSKICAREIQTALSLNKWIVPVLYTDTHEFPDYFPNEIRDINWVFMRNSEEFQNNFAKFFDTLNTDFSWLNEHTRILNRALEWNAKNRNKSYLLQGDDLKSGEAFLSLALSGKKPPPTTFHIEYIQKSQIDAQQKKRRNIIISTLALVILIFMALVAIVAGSIAVTRANEARVQSDIAFSRQVAINSRSVPKTDLDLMLLLAVQANRIDNTLEAQSSLIQAILVDPYLEGIMGGYGNSVNLKNLDVGEELKASNRFGANDWGPVEDSRAEELFPYIFENRLWGEYNHPTHSSTNQQLAYAICKEQSGGGTSFCATYIAIWDHSHSLYTFEKDPICELGNNSAVENLSADYLGSGAFTITNKDTNEIIGTFLSDEIRNGTQQYDQAQIISMDIDDSGSRIVTAIAYGRHYFSFAIILWDIDSEQEIGTLYKGYCSGLIDDEFQLAQFSDNNDSIISCGDDGGPVEPFVINIDSEYLMEKACSIAGRNLTEIEWDRYIGTDIQYQITCPQFPAGGYPIWELNPDK